MPFPELGVPLVPGVADGVPGELGVPGVPEGVVLGLTEGELGVVLGELGVCGVAGVLFGVPGVALGAPGVVFGLEGVCFGTPGTLVPPAVAANMSGTLCGSGRGGILAARRNELCVSGFEIAILAAAFLSGLFSVVGFSFARATATRTAAAAFSGLSPPP